MFDKEKNTYHFTLPMPPSFNRAYTHLPNDRVVRSGEYNQWAQVDAGQSFRRQYPHGTPKILMGRIQAYYMFFFKEDIVMDPKRKRSDTGNREKCLSDYLQGKFIEDDNQIDKTILEKRINPNLARGYVRIWLKEIPDTRFERDIYLQQGVPV